MNTNNKSNMSHNACYAAYYPRLNAYLSKNRRLTRNPRKAHRFLSARSAYDFGGIDCACGISKVREVY